MRIPAYLWTALVVGLYAAVDALKAGVAGNVDDLWVPVIVAVLTALMTGLDKLRTSPPDIVSRGVEERSFLRRFWLGD